MLSFFLVLALMSPSWLTAHAETLVYLGTYTRGSSQGIYVSRLDTTTGALSTPILAAKAENPSFVALHPDRPLLYAVSEVSGNDTIGVMAFQIKADGTLKKLNERSTGGGAACHVSVDPTGRCVGVANYTGGSCVTFPISEDGSLGEDSTFIQHTGGSGANPRRQNEPHAHAFNFNSDGTQAFVNDLGKDQILIYDVDPQTAKMKPAKQPFLALPAGGGPRHFCFDPSFKLAAANLEMTSQVVLLAYNSKQGSIETISMRESLPKGENKKGNSTAECLVHPNGQYVYVSNRGHNSIAAFRLDVDKRTLTPIGNTSSEGAIPRGFGIDPSGQFLVVGNQNSGNVVSFKIDEATGKLQSTGHSIQVDSAVNVRFLNR
ncbi:MAG: lactonase family protein [Planctomycetota bacterium]